MKALLSVTPGGPECLELTQLPDPEPRAGEILIRVHAASVNYPDTLIIRDLYQFKPARPFAPGCEVAGEIVALGSGVTEFENGARVLAMTGHGGFATHIALPATQATQIPREMPFDAASSLMLTYGTSYHALKDRGALRAGETLLILGAAGGVGSAAIELCKAMGARVIAAVSSEEKAQFCRAMGADLTIIYPKELDKDGQKQFSSKLKATAGPAGIDVVYDAVGGNFAEPALRSLNWKGRFLVVGFPAGIPKIPLNLTLLKGCQIIGVFWGAHTKEEPQIHAQNIRDLLEFYREGQIAPRISETFSLEHAAKALERLEAREALGKLVIDMSSEDLK